MMRIISALVIILILSLLGNITSVIQPCTVWTVTSLSPFIFRIILASRIIRGTFGRRLPSLGIRVVLSRLTLELTYFSKFRVHVLDLLVIHVSDIIFTLPLLLY